MAVLIQSGSLNITSAPYGHFDDSGAQQSLLELIALLQLFRDLMVAMRRQLDRLKARIAAKGQQDLVAIGLIDDQGVVVGGASVRDLIDIVGGLVLPRIYMPVIRR